MNRSAMLSMQAANRAAAQSRAWGQQMYRRQLAQGRMMQARARWLASPEGQAHQAMQARAKQLNDLREALRKAVHKKLECEPVPYSKGAAAMLFRSNRTDNNGDPQVIFQCNTNLPGSGTPAAAILWTDKGVETVDLDDVPVQEAIARGRLFIYPAVVALSDGEAYAMLPAAHHQKGRMWSSGKDWLWSFATAGTYRGRPFVVGRGGLGAFIDPSLRHLFVARPQTFSDKSGQWVWTGRSSLEEADRLVVHGEAVFEPPEARAVKYLLPKVTNAPGRVGLACAQRDDRGDPLVVFDTRPRPTKPATPKAASAPAKTARAPAYRLAEAEGRLHFIAAPNGKTAEGAPIFWAPATVEAAGGHLFQVAGTYKGKAVSFGLGANARDASGRPIFVAPARVKLNGAVAVAFPLEAAAHSMEGSTL